MTECEHLGRTSAYFDGELADSEHAVALAHLADCAECQRVLASAVAIDAAASQRASAGATRQAAPHDALAARRMRKRWPVVVVSAGLLAAAAALLFWIVRPASRTEQRLELPASRAVAMRFTGDAFAKHRPYAAMRSGTTAHETISLAALAGLEKRGDLRNLIAALASSGDLARAEQLAAKLPLDAATESDLAAIALARRDAENALAHAFRATDRDPALLAAWWNLGLAAGELGLPRVAKDAFGKVVAAGEPGWSAEATGEIAALDHQISEEDLADVNRRGREMLAGAPLLTAADVAQYPAPARIAFYDALHVALSRDDVERLRPLAQELDEASGLPTAIAALERVAAADFTVRAKVAARYRDLVTANPTDAEVDQLIADLRKLGAPVADIYVDTLLYMNAGASHAAELVAITKPWADPWFDLVVERDRIAAAFPGDDLRAEPALAAALARCTNPAFTMRCGQLAMALGALLLSTGRIEEAEARVHAAVDAHARAHSVRMFRAARTFLGEIHRRRGRFALARAELFEEVLAARTAGICYLERYSQIGLANLAFMSRDFTAARALLPPATPPQGCQPVADVIGLVTAVDIARVTDDPRDHEAARAWVAYARAANAGPAVTVSAARVLPPDPAALTALGAWLATSERGYANDALRVLGYSTLISDAGARSAWTEVLDTATAEYRLVNAPACLVVASLDDTRFTVAYRAGGDVGGDMQLVTGTTPAEISPAIKAKLAACPGIAVIARVGMHGRADLLPAEYPWWFAADRKPATAHTAPRRAVEVIDVQPPPGASLQRLAALGPSREAFDVTLAGAQATPDRVLAALATATYVEIHAHGVVSTANEDAAFLALSPDASGRFALDAGTIRKATLAAAPLVVLAACRAAAVASVFRERWSLPDAFLVAGARGVIAADEPIPDGDARVVLDEIHHRIVAGEDPATALAAVRKARGGWTAHLMLFR